MIDHTLVQNALRARALAVTVCTTGAMTLAATTAGYTRTTGSFVTDGFAVGMEIVPSGFTDNTPRIVQGVSALTLTTTAALTAEAAAAGRSLTVSGIPPLRAWDNVKADPETNRAYVLEQYVPATAQLNTAPSAGGLVEETGLYRLVLYGTPNAGHVALSAIATALLAAYPPGDSQTLTDGSSLHIRGDHGPYRGAITQTPGWALLTLTIPFRAFTTNPT